MPRDFDISPYFEIVKPTIVNGFDYTALHWADKQKPLREVADEIAMFPVVVGTRMVERVTVSEHYLAVEYVAVRQPERRMKPREKAIEVA